MKKRSNRIGYFCVITVELYEYALYDFAGYEHLGKPEPLGKY